MKTAAISELKASLSEYLVRVRAGEEILLTDRGVPIAKLTPLTATNDKDSALIQLARTGQVKLPEKKLSTDFYKRKRISDPKGRILMAMRQEREESR